MAYLGLVPSEHSSGANKRQGAITKAGNSHVRRVLVESAWAYRLPARVTRIIRLRQEKLSKPVRAIGRTRSASTMYSVSSLIIEGQDQAADRDRDCT